MFAPKGANSPPARHRREACALWALGPKAQSDPKRGSETMSATVREARMIEQPGHLPPKVAKRLEGVSKYKGCAQNADICEGAKRAEGAGSTLCED